MKYKKRLAHLSRTISHALRHEPWLYELEIDDEGWVPVHELISALTMHRQKRGELQEEDIIELCESQAKQRFELNEKKIRALYGHSFPKKLIKKPSEPPEILYHGTSPCLIDLIKKEGLKPMSRHYVHFSVDVETAKQVGMRKSRPPIILKINAREAYQQNIKFYIGNEMVWLADYVLSKFIDFSGVK